MKPLLYLLLSALILTSGCKMTSVSIDAMRPGDITLPPHIKTVAVANRSLPAKGNKIGNIAEGILTGEGLHTDRQGSQESMKGVSETISRSPLLTGKQVLDKEFNSSGYGNMDAPIDWETVESTCAENGADALLLLESFDSDATTRYSTKEKKVKNSAGAYYNRMEHRADMDMRINSGWRLYDPRTKTIVDEYSAEDHLSFSGKAWTKEEAYQDLPNKRSAVQQTGYHAGTQYGFRISPMPIKINRSYYKKGNDSFESAARLAKANEWAAATEVWKSMAETSANPKTAGMAAYNMAVASEVQGGLNAALEWAKKSYIEYGNKKAASYIRLLEKRIRDEEKARKQLEQGGKIKSP